MPKPNADLLQPCADLPEPVDATSAALLRWSVDIVYLYNDCKARHKSLVDAVK